MPNDSLGEFSPTFVFLTFSIVWLVVFGYVFYIARRQADIRQDLDDLRREVSQPQNDGGSGPSEPLGPS